MCVEFSRAVKIRAGVALSPSAFDAAPPAPHAIHRIPKSEWERIWAVHENAIEDDCQPTILGSFNFRLGMHANQRNRGLVFRVGIILTRVRLQKAALKGFPYLLPTSRR